MVEELSVINRDLLSLDRALRLHDRVLTSLKVATHQFFGADFDHYVDNIIGEYHKVNAMLEDQKDTLRDLRETNNSLLSTKTNEVIKVLTAITFVTFPSSFISWIFAIDATHKPITGMPYDFWIIVVLMIISSLFTYLYLRAKKWI
jgi:magnesium transporter